MSDREFDVLDELYFVTHFDELGMATNLAPEDLRQVLVSLQEKGWLKVYKTVSEELATANLGSDANYQSYFYLASKNGLLAHNGR